MSGSAYAQSGRIAETMGPFAGFEENRKPMLGVMRKHRDAIKRIDAAHVPMDLLQAAKQSWDEVVQRCSDTGLRNSQISVLAPTGTIAFMMDCDTTGVEPDIALVKYKKLVGGGMIKIVNQTVPTALKRLGYETTQVQSIVEYIDDHDTIEGAPELEDEHLPVFDCAFKPANGARSIHYSGHLKMLAAVQPFISGAISKTINMPNEITAADIEEAYMMSADLGLKAMALYRDGSKASQPLRRPPTKASPMRRTTRSRLRSNAKWTCSPGVFTPGHLPQAAYANLPRPRFMLPARRTGFTQEARVGGHKVFLRTGEYDDGTLGEVFLDLAKEGATLRGILGCFAIAVSKGLQYGVPLEEYVDTFTFQTFEPRGMVEGHPNIKMSNSIVDYVFRALGVEYLQRDELAQVPPDRSSDLPEPPRGMAVDAGLQLDLTEAAMEDDIDDQVRAAAFAEALDASPNGSTMSPNNSTNGTGNGKGAVPAAVAASADPLAGVHSAQEVQTAAVQAVLADKMGDAPLCDTCGHITVRNGSCYRCLNCGESKGCS